MKRLRWPNKLYHCNFKTLKLVKRAGVFFPVGGLGVPPSGKNFVNPPIRHLSPFLDQGLSRIDQKFGNHNWVPFAIMTFSSIARLVCQEGQSERTFPIFAFSSRFFLFFPDFFPLFPNFWQIFLCQGWSSAPVPPGYATDDILKSESGVWPVCILIL